MKEEDEGDEEQGRRKLKRIRLKKRVDQDVKVKTGTY